MAKAPDQELDNDGKEASAEVQPSQLEAKTHAEVCMLYRESTETTRFVKNHQWKTVGATLLAYAGMVMIAGFVQADAGMVNKLMAITILLGFSVITTLFIYQFWMHNEASKIDRMERDLSSLFKEIRALKSRREGNIHRYTLLLFMAIVVFLGGVVVHLALERIVAANGG